MIAPYDKATLDFPRDLKGAYSTEDVYIDCKQKIKIYQYNTKTLQAVIPSQIRGINKLKLIANDCLENVPDSYEELKNALSDNGIIFNIERTDSEILFMFKSNQMPKFEKYLRPYPCFISSHKDKDTGEIVHTGRSPFSTKNLPKRDDNIPTDKLEEYKIVASKIAPEMRLRVGTYTSNYIKTLVTRRNKYENILLDIKNRHCTNRKYIYEIGKFDEYLNYLNKCIEENK